MNVRIRTPLVLVPTVVLIGLFAALAHSAPRLEEHYTRLASPVVRDAGGDVVAIGMNAVGTHALLDTRHPPALRAYVLVQEDQWFYYHSGVHPVRLLAATFAHLNGSDAGGASTLTQQLAKVLLGTGNERTYRNKVRELWATAVLEYRFSKDEILAMYLSVAPLGGTVQGFGAAAQRYFNKPLDTLSESELLSLVPILKGGRAPGSERNAREAAALASALSAPPPLTPEPAPTVPDSQFERIRMGLACSESCTSTLDEDLTRRIRALVAAHTERGASARATHAAVVVIDATRSELLAVVGSPNPESVREGAQLNMAIAPRPIGSTLKPFIYLAAFERGLRPYTLVLDRERRFPLDDGQSLYPKNYDGSYRGAVPLDRALAQSLNAPAVEVLEYVTLPAMYEVLTTRLAVKPQQPLHTYAYGLALGGLELDLVTLTHLYSALAQEGELLPLVVGTRGGAVRTYTPPSSRLTERARIASANDVRLVNALLMDRSLGVEQFGARGSLDLSHDGYAVKTGTSRDYHDAWTIGYTPELVVGVWMGNVENVPMRQVSGSSGAGALFHDVFELLFTTPHYTGKKLSTEGLVRVPTPEGLSWTFPNESFDAHRTLLLADTPLILSPHDGDEYLAAPNVRVPLSARESVSWECSAPGTIEADYLLLPRVGTYSLTARMKDGTAETVTFHVRAEAY